MIWSDHFTKPARPSRSLTLLALPFVWLAATLPSQATPVVGNVHVSQRPGSELVDIPHDVTAYTPTVTVSLRISNEGGTTYNILANTHTSDIGPGTLAGQGKTIVWNAWADWERAFYLATIQLKSRALSYRNQSAV
jgi:hypothetical protein